MVKTLTVTDEAYEKLAARKEAGESFTDVINKITGKASFFDLIGVLSDKEAEEMNKNINERRKAMRARIDNISKVLE